MHTGLYDVFHIVFGVEKTTIDLCVCARHIDEIDIFFAFHGIFFFNDLKFHRYI